MFSGSDSLRIRTSKSAADLEDAVQDSFDRLGRVKFFSRGEFEVRSSKFQTAFAAAQVTGRLKPGRKDGEWVLAVEYSVSPTALCWVLLAFGVVFLFLLGFLLLLIPSAMKSEIQRTVSDALRDARDDIEREDRSDS